MGADKKDRSLRHLSAAANAAAVGNILALVEAHGSPALLAFTWQALLQAHAIDIAYYTNVKQRFDALGEAAPNRRGAIRKCSTPIKAHDEPTPDN